MLIRKILPVVLAGALLTAGCGNDDNDASKEGSTVATTVESPGASGSGGEFCTKVRTYNERFSATFAAVLASPGGASSRTALRERFRELRAIAPDLQKSAPGELAEDLKLVSAGIESLASALEKADFDINKVDRSALTIQTDTRFQAAAGNVGRYLRDVCGISTSPSAPPG